MYFFNSRFLDKFVKYLFEVGDIFLLYLIILRFSWRMISVCGFTFNGKEEFGFYPEFIGSECELNA